MNNSNMDIKTFVETTQSPLYVYTNIEIEGEKKKVCDDIKNNDIFTPEMEDIRRDINKTKTTRKYKQKCNTIAFDTTECIQLDIDLKTKEDYDNLTDKAKKTIINLFQKNMEFIL